MKKSVKIFVVLGMFCLISVLGQESKTSATSYYDACVEGKQEDGTYIMKISKETMQSGQECMALQNAFYTAKENASSKMHYIIVVEPGIYNLGFSLHMYRYTTLYAEGVTFNLKGHTGNMLKVGDVGSIGDKKKGYYYKDIKVNGGTWNGNRTQKPIYRAAHCKNLVIQNAVFKSCVNTHLMEVAALDGFTVRNCVFKDGYRAKGNKNSLANEAIQIDITQKNHFGAVASEIITSRNITIENNSFENVLRGVGSHTAWVGLPMTNIKIVGNTFKDIPSVAIECLNYRGCLIENNTMVRCGRGVSVFSVFSNANGMYNSKKKASKTLNAKTIIRNNTIDVQNTDTCVSSGIAIQGANLKKATKGDGDKIAKGNYAVSNVQIYNNNISTKAMGILIRDGRKITIKNNTVASNGKGNNYGILVKEASQGVRIQENTITAAKTKNQYAIVVSADSKKVTVKKNTIKRHKKTVLNLGH